MSLYIHYNITKPFPWKWFGPVVVGLATIALALLTTLNVALTGYETIPVFLSDFNATQSHWFNHFLPTRAPAPGTLCDPHVFNLGDSFTTNYRLFEWKIDSIRKANAGDSGVSYTGSTLEDCDVSALYVAGDIITFTVDYTAILTCKSKLGFEFDARTDFSISRNPGKYSPLLGAMRASDIGKDGSFNATTDGAGVGLDAVTSLASDDFGSRAFSLFQASNQSTVVKVSAVVEFPFCPFSLGPDASCAVHPPTFNFTDAFTSYQNLTYYQYSTTLPIGENENKPLDSVIGLDTFTPLSNIFQSIHALVRIDLGNPSTNNFLLSRNATLLNNTLYATYPETLPNTFNQSALFRFLTNPPKYLGQDVFPLNIYAGPATLDMVYLCRFQMRKEFSQGLIAVLVATLSMFSSGWAIFLLIATYAVNRQDPNANIPNIPAGTFIPVMQDEKQYA